MGSGELHSKATQRSRIKYTQDQIDLLEQSFSESQYPDTATLESIADKLSVSMEKVSIWFQNRRSKFKRQSKDTHMAWMRKQLYNIDHAPRDSCLQVTQRKNEKRHVLSPPEPMKDQYEYTWHRPSSNLHYIPSVSPFMESLFESSPAATTNHPSAQLSPYHTPASEMTREDSLKQHRPSVMPVIKENYQCQRQYSIAARPSCQFFANNYALSAYPSTGQPQFSTNQMPTMVMTQGFGC